MLNKIIQKSINSFRWKAKKEGASSKADTKDEEGGEKKANVQTPLLKLTGLVDQLVSDGQFEAYGYTYEKISYELEKMHNLSNFDKGADKGAADAADAELDIFADTIDDEKLKSKTDHPPAASIPAEKGIWKPLSKNFFRESVKVSIHNMSIL